MLEHKTENLIIRISPTLKGRCEKVATKAGLSLSDWVRAVLATAANQGAFAPRPKKKAKRTRRKEG